MTPVGRFRFSLEAVLRVKSLREEQAQLEVARAQEQVDRSRRSLMEAQTRWRQWLQELQDDRHKEWRSADYQLFKNYLEHLKLAIMGWQERLKQDEAELARKKLVLQNLHQERRLLEKLRQKKFRQYLREVTKVWEKETEAIALTRWPGNRLVR